MEKPNDNIVKSRKAGMEHIIMMRLPYDRFRCIIPSHINPVVDKKSRIQITLLAQACEKNSFDNEEAGPTDDLHLWLQLESPERKSHVKGADFMLPAMKWFLLASATSNRLARSYMQSFGFNPLNLAKTDLHENGGSLKFSGGGMIDWIINGNGKKYKVPVSIILFTPEKMDLIPTAIKSLH